MYPQERFNFDFFLRENGINFIDFFDFSNFIDVDNLFEDCHFIKMQFVLEEFKKKIPEEERYLTSPQWQLFVIEKTIKVKTILQYNYFFDHKFLIILKQYQILLLMKLNLRPLRPYKPLRPLRPYKPLIFLNRMEDFNEQAIGRALRIGKEHEINEQAIGRALRIGKEHEINENIKPHKKFYKKTQNKLNSHFNKKPYKKNVGHFPGKNKNR
jgi:hypothetical protein